MARMEIRADKQALMSPMLRLMCGDTRTQIIRIMIPRLFGDVDLCNLAWSIKVVNPKGATDVCLPHGNVTCSEDVIEIDWLVCDVATAAPGVTDFEVVGVDEDAEGHPIVWKSGIGKILVTECLNAEPSTDQKTDLTELDKLIVYVRGELPNVIAAAERANAAADRIEINGRGERGYGITNISTVRTVSGTKVTIEYESEDGPQTRTINLLNGASPSVSVTPTAKGYRLSVSDGFGSIQSVEIKHGKDSIISPEDVAKAVNEYLADHPAGALSVTINGEGPDENGNFVINTINDVEVAQLFAALT